MTRRILLIRYGALGDILLTTPLIRELARQLPDAEIDVLVRSRYRDLVAGNPVVKRVFELRGERWWSIVAPLRERRYDLVLDLQNKLKSRLLAFATGAPRVIRLVRRGPKELLSEWRQGPKPAPHTEAWRYLSLLDQLALERPANPEVELDFFLGETERESAARALGGQHPIGLVVGASRATKRWELSHFVGLARELWLRDGCKPIVLAGPADLAWIAPALPELEGVANVAPIDSTIAGIAGYIAACRIVVGVDGGLLHLASALRRPVVALFGPTDPNRWRPNGGSWRVVRRELACSPCRSHGSRTCPLGHHSCMRELTVEMVIQAIESLEKSLRPS